MNGTVIDIPGISVSVTPIDLQDSTDISYIIEIKDQQDHGVKLEVCYGRITAIKPHEQSIQNK